MDSEALVFGDSGLRYDEAVVFYDRATDSKWDQWQGLGFAGPMAGVLLVRHAAETTTWSAWLSRNPDTVVLAAD